MKYFKYQDDQRAPRRRGEGNEGEGEEETG